MILPLFLRRPCTFLKSSSLVDNFLGRRCKFCSVPTGLSDRIIDNRSCTVHDTEESYPRRLHLSSFNHAESPSDGDCNVKLMDNDTWKFTSCLSRYWQSLEKEKQNKLPDDGCVMDERKRHAVAGDDPDLDELDMMRVRGDLLYKVNKSSREFEEYSIEFPKKKSSKRRDGRKVQSLQDEMLEKKERQSSCKTKIDERFKSEVADSPTRVVLNGKEYYSLTDKVETKKKRTPTFNQLTGPYHEPFSLEILITKASIRASVTHRVTSNVVAVAHSISKDMKAELSSTRNATACAFVGEVLAQRALADDIHNVVYTPRKGEKVEGKLNIVLQTIMDAGVNVNVKIKQRQRHKPIHLPSNT